MGKLGNMVKGGGARTVTDLNVPCASTPTLNPTQGKSNVRMVMYVDIVRPEIMSIFELPYGCTNIVMKGYTYYHIAILAIIVGWFCFWCSNDHHELGIVMWLG